MSKIRREHPACTEGRYRELLLTNRQYAFCRYSDSDYLLVAVNNDSQEAEVQIPVEGAFTYINVLTKEEAPGGKRQSGSKASGMRMRVAGACLKNYGNHSADWTVTIDSQG